MSSSYISKCPSHDPYLGVFRSALPRRPPVLRTALLHYVTVLRCTTPHQSPRSVRSREVVLVPTFNRRPKSLFLEQQLESSYHLYFSLTSPLFASTPLLHRSPPFCKFFELSLHPSLPIVDLLLQNKQILSSLNLSEFERILSILSTNSFR